jgi:hypothetical protein
MVEYWPEDPTSKGDRVAGLMRDYYETNKPLRWWQKRRTNYESCIADDLMLGLLNIVLSEYHRR